MDKEQISAICKKYDIDPVEVELLRSSEKVLVKVTSDAHYLLKGERAEFSYWEASCHYAHLLYKNNMNVARYLKNRDSCYVTEQESFVFTLEQELRGQELTDMTDALLYKLGRFLGEQHNISMQLKSPFTTATSWSLFGGNATENIGDYDENELSFLEFQGSYQSHPLFATIESRYLEYRKVLQKAWAQLPQGAVQGDFCYYNMLQEENGSLAIFDFNLAGNEVYMNEAVAVAVYHAWHAPYEGNLTEQERYLVFLTSYNDERPFIESELVLLPLLKSVVRAFRFDRVEAGVSLEDEQKRNEFMQETLDILREA